MKRYLLLLWIVIFLLALPTNALAMRRVDLDHIGAYNFMGETSVTPVGGGRVRLITTGMIANGTLSCANPANCPAGLDGASYSYTQDLGIVIDVIGAGIVIDVIGAGSRGTYTFDVGNGIMLDFRAVLRNPQINCVPAGTAQSECTVTMRMQGRLALPNSGRVVGFQRTTINGTLLVRESGEGVSAAWTGATTAGTLSFGGTVLDGTDI